MQNGRKKEKRERGERKEGGGSEIKIPRMDGRERFHWKWRRESPVSTLVIPPRDVPGRKPNSRMGWRTNMSRIVGRKKF